MGRRSKPLSRRSFISGVAGVSAAIGNIAQDGGSCRGLLRSRQIEIVRTRVFAVGPNGGNPCPVVLSADWLNDREMQSLARRFGVDTVFVLQPQSKCAEIRLRYFVPEHEMGVSGHATIAAVTVSVTDGAIKRNPLRIDTISGPFEVTWTGPTENIVVTLEQNKPLFGAIGPTDRVAHALKIARGQITLTESPIQSVSVSRAKLLVPLKDWIVLDTMTPDLESLWRLCEELQVTGLYAFSRRTNKERADVEARQFPRRAGFPEDAATGVAAAALGAYLARYDHKCRTGQYQFQIGQGYAMGAPSRIQAIAECADGKVTRTAIRGAARIIGREQIALS